MKPLRWPEPHTVNPSYLWGAPVDPYSRRVNTCAKCGGVTLTSEGPHSPRWVVVDGVHVVVDCAGAVVRRA